MLQTCTGTSSSTLIDKQQIWLKSVVMHFKIMCFIVEQWYQLIINYYYCMCTNTLVYYMSLAFLCQTTVAVGRKGGEILYCSRFHETLEHHQRFSTLSVLCLNLRPNSISILPQRALGVMCFITRPEAAGTITKKGVGNEYTSLIVSPAQYLLVCCQIGMNSATWW